MRDRPADLSSAGTLGRRSAWSLKSSAGRSFADGLQENFFQRTPLRPQVANLLAQLGGDLPQHVGRLAVGQVHEQHAVVRLRGAASLTQALKKRLRVTLQS